MTHITFKNTVTYPKLKQHFEQMAKSSLKELFVQDPKRFNKFSILLEDMLLDYSKNFITKESIDLLLDFAKDLKLKEQIDKIHHNAHNQCFIANSVTTKIHIKQS